MNAAQLINQDSGSDEYFTPSKITDAARETMGAIDLDPASCKQANRTIKAAVIFTKELDGLQQDWHGTIWLNMPFGRDTNRPWIRKLISEFYSARVHQACCITFACTSEAWFQPLLNFPQCFLSPRTNYLLPDGTIKRGVTKGSVVTYLGPNIDRFADSFAHLGIVKIAYHSK